MKLMSLAYPQWTRGHTVLHHRFAILRRYCHLAYPSTPRSSALQNHKSEMQNSFGPQPPNFGGWQGNGWRRTGCTPTDVNAASRQKTVVEACVPLSTEGMLYILTLLTASSISYRPFSCNILLFIRTTNNRIGTGKYICFSTTFFFCRHLADYNYLICFKIA